MLFHPCCRSCTADNWNKSQSSSPQDLLLLHNSQKENLCLDNFFRKYKLLEAVKKGAFKREYRDDKDREELIKDKSDGDKVSKGEVDRDEVSKGEVDRDEVIK